MFFMRLLTLPQFGGHPKCPKNWGKVSHVVDEYETSLQFLVDLLQTSDADSAAQKLESWIAYTRDMTVWKLGYMVEQLQGRYEKYLPPESESDDETLLP